MIDPRIRQFIIQLLLEKGPIPAHIPIDEYRYLDVRHIDSLAFIKFIFRVEEKFGIRLTEADIAGQPIRTVGGLTDLIANRIG